VFVAPLIVAFVVPPALITALRYAAASGSKVGGGEEVTVGVGVEVGVNVGVEVGVNVGVEVIVGVGVTVLVTVGVGVGVGHGDDHTAEPVNIASGVLIFGYAKPPENVVPV